MKILMFGWEFPPHISGGLGTACSGLSSALLEQGVELLFVVPKSYGDESMPLISASDVSVGQEGESENVIPKEVFEGSRRVTVQSALKPYTATASVNEVEDWNWQFVIEPQKKERPHEGVRYNFTGKYGPFLLDEVYRYAEVAAVIARENTFDVVHAHDWLTYPAGIAAKKVSGKPLVVHVHATEFDRAENIDQSVFRIEKEGMDEADLIIAVSQWTKDVILQKYGIDPRKVHVVHNGVMPATGGRFSFMPRIGDHVVTFLGRITYQKGPEYFIDAAAKVLDHFPDMHFIMAGSGDLLPAMIEKVARLKLSSRIHFTGFLRSRQIHQIWTVTDVYVMPSVSEPFGITPLEAVQAGVPVIVSNQSGVSEVMDHVIKVDFWDTDELANAIVNILKHDALSRSLKLNSKKEAEFLTWTRAAKKINQLYHGL